MLGLVAAVLLVLVAGCAGLQEHQKTEELELVEVTHVLAMPEKVSELEFISGSNTLVKVSSVKHVTQPRRMLSRRFGVLDLHTRSFENLVEVPSSGFVWEKGAQFDIGRVSYMREPWVPGVSEGPTYHEVFFDGRPAYASRLATLKGSRVISYVKVPKKRQGVFWLKGGSLARWDFETASVLWETEVALPIRQEFWWHHMIALAMNDQAVLLADAKSGILALVEFDSGEVRRFKPFAGHEFANMQVSSDGLKVLVSSNTGSFKLYDLTNLDVYVEFGEQFKLGRAKLSPNAKCVAAADKYGAIRVFTVSNGDRVAYFKANEGWVETLSISANGTFAVSSGPKKIVNKWAMPAICH